MYLGHFYEVLYKPIVPFKGFLFVHNVVQIFVTRAHGAYVMNDVRVLNC